jgi:aquaporin Z
MTDLFQDYARAFPAYETLKKNWGWTVAFGALLAIAGGFALSSVVMSTAATVIFVGFAMIVGGFAEVFHGFAMRTWGHFFWMLVMGGFYILAGALVVRNPLLAATFITLMIGASLLASGIVRTYIAVQLPSGGAKGFLVFSGILTLVVGALIIAQWPSSSLWVIGVFLGADLFFAGMGWVGVGLTMRNAP